MNMLLEEVFSTRKFINSKGQKLEIHGETSKGQCGFLQEIIRNHKFTKSLEIGFAFGLSALAIVEEIVKNDGRRHCVIDKFQHADWGGNGLDLIRQSGYEEELEFYEEYSYKVLPSLLSDGRRFDFVYIDSTKVFDWLLVDFFFIDKMLEIGGIIVFDDTGYFSIRKLARLIQGLPHYNVVGSYPENIKPSVLNRVTGFLTSVPPFRSVLKVGVSYTDYTKHINSGGCLAFQKTGEDQRDWKWHKEF